MIVRFVQQSVLVMLVSSGLFAFEENSRAMLSVSEKNKEADRAFLNWKVGDLDSCLSKGLRKLLDTKAVSYVVEASQLPLTRATSHTLIAKKIQMVTDQFLNKFNPNQKVKVSRREVENLVKDVISPEYIFVDHTSKPRESNSRNELDTAYDAMLDTLRVRKTRVGTTLEEWALRFLTSESQLVALTMIERLEIQGKRFNQMTPREKKHALQPVIDVIALRFINNLQPVKEKFRFTLPLHADLAIKRKLRTFFYQKFVD